MWGALIRRSVVCCTPAPAPAPLSLRDDRVEGATTELTAVGGPRVRISLPPAESLLRTEEREGKLYAIKSTRTEQLSRGPPPIRRPPRPSPRSADCGELCCRALPLAQVYPKSRGRSGHASFVANGGRKLRHIPIR